jgi:hypothetical protein
MKKVTLVQSLLGNILNTRWFHNTHGTIIITETNPIQRKLSAGDLQSTFPNQLEAPVITSGNFFENDKSLKRYHPMCNQFILL